MSKHILVKSIVKIEIDGNASPSWISLRDFTKNEWIKFKKFVKPAKNTQVKKPISEWTRPAEIKGISICVAPGGRECDVEVSYNDFIKSITIIDDASVMDAHKIVFGGTKYTNFEKNIFDAFEELGNDKIEEEKQRIAEEKWNEERVKKFHKEKVLFKEEFKNLWDKIKDLKNKVIDKEDQDIDIDRLARFITDELLRSKDQLRIFDAKTFEDAMDTLDFENFSSFKSAILKNQENFLNQTDKFLSDPNFKTKGERRLQCIRQGLLTLFKPIYDQCIELIDEDPDKEDGVLDIVDKYWEHDGKTIIKHRIIDVLDPERGQWCVGEGAFDTNRRIERNGNMFYERLKKTHCQIAKDLTNLKETRAFLKALPKYE